MDNSSKPTEQPKNLDFYRDEYLKSKLNALNVVDEVDKAAALDYINAYANDDDSNLDQLFDEIGERMAIKAEENKPKYIDPTPFNGLRYKPEQIDQREYGKQMYQRLKRKGKIK